MLERLVCERINIHLSTTYRRYSTETALNKVVSDIIMAADARRRDDVGAP